ncbi:MAG: class I SAM-dependent methyltransferase [Candidatus Saganbacteria bacterium]|nr:class I SAM-dependent methyltransferase [Candidatus Saganbacteria bacterium]
MVFNELKEASKIKEWDNSYARGDNFAWYPHEEVVRFVSRYVVKRTDISKFESVATSPGKKILCFGCGIGRHVFFLDDMQMDPYGVDISSRALDKAREWSKALKKDCLADRFILMEEDLPLPFEDGFFNHIISHGVFDSMTFKLAKRNIIEVGRVLRKGGLFYLDLVSGNDANHYREFQGEEIVNSMHEKGTVQLYFNFHGILTLFTDTNFSIKDIVLIKREKLQEQGSNSRYHIVAEKM